MAVSGPASRAAPDLLMGTVGWGLYAPVVLPTSAPYRRRILADSRQLHYNPPGSIPGPGGDFLVGPELPRSVGPVAVTTAPMTLATVPAGLRPWASSVRQPA
jgi:hypothetical protein